MKTNRFLSIFSTKKPVLGMLHLKGETTEDVIKRAYEESKKMIDNGVNAVIVENYFGSAENAERVLYKFQKEQVDFIYGCNILNNDSENMRIGTKYGAAFIQIDSVAGHLELADDEKFGKFIEETRSIYSGAVIGGVRFKYQPYKSGRSLEEDLRIGMERCDAIAVTGEGTGMPTPVSKIKEFRDIVGSEFPLVAAAGMLPETCAEEFTYADAAIVGSYFKDTYKDKGDVDEEHVKVFMDAVRKCR
ncbi:MAG: BtpA/SgcQ family protein [Lachnospiraceae bacterium]|nr:BtpA/SgcQ family protein [Lachnospiraceae bacterium]